MRSVTKAKRPILQRPHRLMAPLGLVLLGCGVNGTTGPGLPERPEVDGLPAPIAARIEIVSGNAQEGKTSVTLDQPLVVRVTDQSGVPIRNALVRWAVTAGRGALEGGSSATPPSESVTFTDFLGHAEASLSPRSLGPIEVTASVVGASSSTVRFTAQATVLVILQLWGTGYWVGPEGGRVIVPVGTPIEWSPLDFLEVRLRSIHAPPGGESFDVDWNMWPEFRFVPKVAGEWTYTVDYRLEGELIGGDTLSFTAR